MFNNAQMLVIKCNKTSTNCSRKRQKQSNSCDWSPKRTFISTVEYWKLFIKLWKRYFCLCMVAKIYVKKKNNRMKKCILWLFIHIYIFYRFLLHRFNYFLFWWWLGVKILNWGAKKGYKTEAIVVQDKNWFKNRNFH